jgi:hypothetical protein
LPQELHLEPLLGDLLVLWTDYPGSLAGQEFGRDRIAWLEPLLEIMRYRQRNFYARK